MAGAGDDGPGGTGAPGRDRGNGRPGWARELGRFGAPRGLGQWETRVGLGTVGFGAVGSQGVDVRTWGSGSPRVPGG